MLVKEVLIAVASRDTVSAMDMFREPWSWASSIEVCSWGPVLCFWRELFILHTESFRPASSSFNDLRSHRSSDNSRS